MFLSICYFLSASNIIVFCALFFAIANGDDYAEVQSLLWYLEIQLFDFEPLEEMTGRSFSLFLLAVVCPLSLFGGNSVIMLGLDSCSESVLICPS